MYHRIYTFYPPPQMQTYYSFSPYNTYLIPNQVHQQPMSYDDVHILFEDRKIIHPDPPMILQPNQSNQSINETTSSESCSSSESNNMKIPIDHVRKI